MKGSHKVEDFIEWFKHQENFPLATRTHLAAKIKNTADMASALAKDTTLDITRQGEVVMKMRFFDDGSMAVGYPADLKWQGTQKPALFPTEKELV